jgi:membrane protein required for colicin V production
MPFSWLDVILVAIMLISGFLAMLRGLTREVLSILAWAVAAIATLYLFPIWQDQARAYIEPAILADGVLAAAIFLLVLIVVSLITVRVSDGVLDSRVGAVDRTFGFLFGVARGLILVVIAYLFFSWLVPEDTQPTWIRDARSLPILKKTGDAIVALLPEDPAAHLPGASDEKPELPEGAPQPAPDAPGEAPPAEQPAPGQRSEALGARYAAAQVN